MLKLLFLFCLFFVNILFANEIEQRDFDIWIANFKNTAEKKYKIKKNLIEEAFKNVKLNEKIIYLDRNQPEIKKTFCDYYKDIIKNDRIKNGQKHLEKYSDLLKKAEKKYNVPSNIIVAFWDMETHFGKNIGKSYIINVLANLAFEPRRTAFFTEELIFALKILQKKQVSIENFKGSWAGAFGNFQFMPSTFTKYAVDGDNDGKIDIYKSIPDSIFSAANFLSKIGYDGKVKWGRPVYIDNDNEKMWDLVNSKEWMNLDFFAKNNVLTFDKKKKIPVINIKAKLIAPMGKDGPVFLIYDNFKAIMRWNNSTKYALSIGLLSDAYLNKEFSLMSKCQK
jgi:membrane-bound lytic murein transglycosylase B